jgi:hypothetical protein
MREQADVVETELARRISEMSDAMQKMIHNMREVKKSRNRETISIYSV